MNILTSTEISFVSGSGNLVCRCVKAGSMLYFGQIELNTLDFVTAKGKCAANCCYDELQKLPAKERIGVRWKISHGDVVDFFQGEC